MVSTLFHIDKRLQKSFYDVFIRFGINYYISNSYFSSIELPKKIEGDLNKATVQIRGCDIALCAHQEKESDFSANQLLLHPFQ